MKQKLIISLCIVLAMLIIVFPQFSTAFGLSSGFDGVDHYRSIGGCDFGDRFGVEYINNLNNVISRHFSRAFSNEDKYAWEHDLTQSYSYYSANRVDFFAFAGHGVGATFLGNGNGAAHFFTQNSAYPPYHPSHWADACNADWSEISWGSHSGSGCHLKWATMYCCHFLQNYGNQNYYNNLKHIFNGVHLVMGFASSMYLDSSEGTLYGTYISQGMSFKDAFLKAARIKQSGHGFEVIARVMGAIKSENDKYWSYSKDPDPFLEHPEEYGYWSETIY